MTDLSWTNETRKLSDLTPWDVNPRFMDAAQADRLSDSFEVFGQVETIAIGPGPAADVYNGHQRLSVLMDQHGGDYVVDVRVSSRPLTYDERRKLTIYLHVGATGEFDDVAIAKIFEADELEEWGMPDWQIDDIFESIENLDAAGSDGIGAGEARATLAERFIVPPFSILDARQGYWQDRKRAWIALGIESELGRGSEIAPGGSLLPAASLVDGKTVRGDGRGRTLGAIAPNEAGKDGILTRTGKYKTGSK